MSTFKLKHLLAGAAMLAAAAGAVALKPTIRMAEQRPINLEKMVPISFGDWHLDSNTVPVQVNPEIQARLTELYSQVLSRTYANKSGEKVMLSLAYGADQSDKYQVHRPEICYPAQGYQIYGLKKQRLVSAYGEIAAQKLFARRNNGVIEEIDYWVMVGDVLVFSGFDRKLAQLKYGFGGKIPDGMLIRISSLSEDGNSSRQNRKFIDDLLQALNANDRARIIGY